MVSIQFQCRKACNRDTYSVRRNKQFKIETATRISLVNILCVLDTIPKQHKNIQGIVPMDEDGHVAIGQFTELRPF